MLDAHDRRGAGARQPARLQPEQPRATLTGAQTAQPRRHRHLRAGLDAQALHRRRGAGGRASFRPRHVDPDRAGQPDHRQRARSATPIPHGALTVAQVIQKSSNVGAAKIALALPPQRHVAMFCRGSGFGTAPRLGFPGEASGRLRPLPAPGSRSSRPPWPTATASRSACCSWRAPTPIFASDGELLPLSLLQARRRAERRARVLAARPRARCARMLEMAVQPGGTAPQARRSPGYRVAGKTGTAHKLEGGGYAPDQLRRRRSSASRRCPTRAWSSR
ncbi:MAG: penicillin-binding transpeptidase domain-containing protein [Comamonadaceae bacterium]|nr:penicillin-binding transpeptidase domain-containing protein [Comamonadaceae bacterium]